jgi:hypothetical protein
MGAVGVRPLGQYGSTTDVMYPSMVMGIVSPLADDDPPPDGPPAEDVGEGAAVDDGDPDRVRPPVKGGREMTVM